MPTGYDIMRDQNVTPAQWVNYYATKGRNPFEQQVAPVEQQVVAPIEFTYGDASIGSPFGENSPPMFPNYGDKPSMATLASILQLNNKPYTQGKTSNINPLPVIGNRGNSDVLRYPTYGTAPWPYIDPTGTVR